ncbi:hypothetical protein IKW75_02625 [Candidatus Saccharibacteria bacterium]|nr:hypothetical protein [Candidatus Saccharibacteria bacterium]
MKSDLFIIVLAGFIHAMLQLGVGTLLLLYHASLGKHIKRKTHEVVTSYIFGNGFLTLVSVAAMAFVIFTIFNGAMNPAMLTIVVGILVALAFSVWMFYYRWGKSTELWLPKSIAKFINKRANLTDSVTEAFGLGMLACFAEIPFTFILVAVAANSILDLPEGLRILMVVAYTLLSIVPLIVLRVAIKQGQTAVDAQKWRLKNKNFLRIASGAAFAVLAFFVLVFKVIGV